MKVEDIEIHTGIVGFQFEPLRRVEAKCESPTVFSKAPTIEDVNQKLRELAVRIGANAIVEVTYESGPTITAWRSVRGKGLAVTRVADEMACPVCAETIKRAALRCRFCGADIPRNTGNLPVPQQLEVAAVPRAPSNQEPLRSSDNPQIWIWVVVGFIVLMFLIEIASQ